MNKQIFIFLGTYFVLASGVALPSYFKKCKRDADFDNCALASGKETLKTLIKGEKSLRIPPLAPLNIPFVQLQATDTLKLNLTELSIIGLEKAEVKKVHADFDKREVVLEVHADELLLKATYHVDGRILILPIKGDGPGSIHVDDADFRYTFNFDLIDKDGQKFAKLTKDDFKFVVNKKAVFRLDNLFNGDERLGAETNKFINENWSEVLKEFEPAISGTIASVCQQIAGNVFERVPYEEIFDH